MDFHDKIQHVPIDDLSPYGANPKTHPSEQVEKIARSIQDFGFTVPLVVDENNTIIMGHCRLYAAQQLGLDAVPCIVRDDLTDAEARALRIADNRVAESAWDNELLESEIADLSDFDIDLESTGFLSEELEDILLNEEQIEEVSIPDDEFLLMVECKNDSEREELYNMLTEEGYECRLLT